jgi:hypothetical protein
MHNPLKGEDEKQLPKKKFNISSSSIFNFLVTKECFKKDDV